MVAPVCSARLRMKTCDRSMARVGYGPLVRMRSVVGSTTSTELIAWV